MGLHFVQKSNGPNNTTKLKQVGWNHQILERRPCDYQFKANTQITVSMCQVMSNSCRTWKNLLGTQLRWLYIAKQRTPEKLPIYNLANLAVIYKCVPHPYGFQAVTSTVPSAEISWSFPVETLRFKDFILCSSLLITFLK